MAFCAVGDVEVACGGAKFLLQLADFDDTGDLNNINVQSVISGWMEDEAATIRSKAEIKHDPETLANLDTPSLRKLLDVNATLAARTAYEKGAKGLALPPHLEARCVRADKFLDDLATGNARLGRVAGGGVPALNQKVGVVDYDRNRDGVSVASLRKYGFR